MDTQISKLFRIMVGEYYCSNCTSHFEIDLTIPKPHQVCGECGSHAFLKLLVDKEVSA